MLYSFAQFGPLICFFNQSKRSANDFPIILEFIPDTIILKISLFADMGIKTTKHSKGGNH